LNGIFFVGSGEKKESEKSSKQTNKNKNTDKIETKEGKKQKWPRNIHIPQDDSISIGIYRAERRARRAKV
jgi:hypothetical protein